MVNDSDQNMRQQNNLSSTVQSIWLSSIVIVTYKLYLKYPTNEPIQGKSSRTLFFSAEHTLSRSSTDL